MRGVFVTGTDTDVGKTLVSAAILAATEASYYWKPIQTGAKDLASVDCEAVLGLAELSRSRIIPSIYSFADPVSPHLAATQENRTIVLERFTTPEVQPLVVEGAGGVLVPLNKTDLMVDLIKRLQLPALVVARSTLGTINHTLLTLEALRTRGILVAGVVMNGPINFENRIAIETYGKVKVIAAIPPLNTIAKQVLAEYGKPIAESLWGQG